MHPSFATTGPTLTGRTLTFHLAKLGYMPSIREHFCYKVAKGVAQYGRLQINANLPGLIWALNQIPTILGTIGAMVSNDRCISVCYR